MDSIAWLKVPAVVRSVSYPVDVLPPDEADARECLDTFDLCQRPYVTTDVVTHAVIGHRPMTTSRPVPSMVPAATVTSSRPRCVPR
jgi:hypothetical protein